MNIKHIAPIELFHTPENISEVEAWIEEHAPEERAHLYTATMMTWNLMCGYHNDHVDALHAELVKNAKTLATRERVIEMLLVQVQEYSENEIVNGDGVAMTINQIKELIK